MWRLSTGIASRELTHILTQKCGENKISITNGLDSVVGLLTSVQREDGSGNSFNIIVDVWDGQKTVAHKIYVRCKS